MREHSPLDPPPLETDRLILRGHKLQDFAPCAAMWADPEVVKQIGLGKPSSEAQTWGRILNYVGHWRLMGFGFWAVEEKSSGQFIGELGFADFKRELSPSIQGLPELGWALATCAHGKGYASEALRAVVEWGDRFFEGPRTVCIIHPENLASLRVAEKMGYQLVQTTHYAGSPVILFSRTRNSKLPKLGEK